MRTKLAAAALAGVLLTASCGGGGSEGAETEIAAGLESAPVDVLVSGVVGATDPATMEIEHVLWSRGPHRDAAGHLVIPKSLDPGETVDLESASGLDDGSRYLVLANQELSPQGHQLLSVFGAIDPATNAMVVPFTPTPGELMLPGESGLISEVDALIELLSDSARFHGAKASPPPLTRRLAHAFQLAEERHGGSGTIGVDALAMEDYLLLDGSRRTIPAGSELPEIVVESLGLKPFRARVVLPEGFAETHWAIGLQSSAGIVGPIELAPGQSVVDIAGLRAKGAPMRLVAWESDPGPASALDGAAIKVGKKSFREDLATASKNLKERFLLVLDVAAGVVSVDKSGGTAVPDGV